jgi:hypothetical protein
MSLGASLIKVAIRCANMNEPGTSDRNLQTIKQSKNSSVNRLAVAE